MSFRRRARAGAVRSALVGVLVSGLVVGVVAPTGASHGTGGSVVAARAGSGAVLEPEAAPVKYVKKPHDPTIYVVEGIDHRRLTYAQWLAAGSPVPSPTQTEFVRYPWSPTVYAVTYWSAAVRDWDRLTGDTWSAAGRPEPRMTGWIPGSTIHRWDSSPELFLRGPDRSLHKLTEREWAATGYRAPTVRANEGFVKLSWNGSIARMSDLRYGQGRPISYTEWLAEGSPSPRVAPRFPGDIFEKDFSGPAIRYSGPTVQKYLTPAEWQAAGAPAPYTGRNGRLDTATLCPVSWKRSVLLRCDAQRALERLNSAYWGRFGRSMSIGYGYRTYATQVYLRMTLGTVAAVPGTSNHGWGLALDTAEGSQHGFGSASYEWLKVNAPAFGWHAPRWAWQDGSNPEYWHFEYTG
ncbi:M15 family metallopeptidase [Cellulosimicrobium sp. NPDC057862]|uniref:M15 family metallopeptidase n=1 Tax=Cellulosimicrobium sp. NPDC057862 TaxID=3346266 RepID=UPI00366F8EE5